MSFNLIDTDDFKAGITQGATYQISFLYPEDITNCVVKGQIRTNFAQNGGDLLAEFSFLPLVYDDFLNKTTVTAQLSAEQTESIPFTKFQGVGLVSIKNCYVYDMEIIYISGEVKKLVPYGFVQVKPEVTKYE